MRLARLSSGRTHQAPCPTPPTTTARARRLDTLTVEKLNGEGVYGTELALALQESGFVATPRGYTLRKVV